MLTAKDIKTIEAKYTKQPSDYTLIQAFRDQLNDGTLSPCLKHMKKKLPDLTNAYKAVNLANIDSFSKWFWKLMIPAMLDIETRELIAKYERLSKLMQKSQVSITESPLDINKAKSVPLQHLLDNDGLTVVRKGGRLKTKCPFHNEKSPSFVIFPNNKYYCFGCHAKGDTINYTQQSRGMTFTQAVNYLCQL